MPSNASVPTRRRTNSYAGVSDFSVKRKPSGSLCRPATEDSNLLALSELPKPTRFRRSSFALSGERPTRLDDLVQQAASHTTNVAAARAASKITCITPSPSEAVEFEGGLCSSTNTDSDESQRKLSVATLASSPAVLVSPPEESTSLSVSKSRKSSIPNSKENLLLWHNTNTLAQNPLSSELVRNYLAMVTAEHPLPQPEVHVSTSPKCSSAISGNLPGFLQFTVPPVASMTIPVHQIRRAHANNTRSNASHTHYLDRNACTDANYSSGMSDAELWQPLSNQQLDCQSDNYMRDAASEAKMLRITGQRLEADYHLSTGSLPRSKRIRSRSKAGITPLGPRSPATTPPSMRSSKFDLTHVYEGLPMNMAASTASSIASSPDSRQPCPTPPSSPSFGRTMDRENQNSLGHANGLGRLRLLFDHLKPQVTGEDNENYFYLDQQAQERRANARASNVIAPVSF